MSTVSEPLTRPVPARAVRVTRSSLPTWWLGPAVAGLVVVGAFLPYIVFSSTTNLLVNVFILITMASMWNLLAGYAGLVSVGQQAFVGLGAYGILIFAQRGVNPFLSIPLVVVATGVIGGLGSLWGTLAGGIFLGVVQQIGAQINPENQILFGQVAFLLVLVFLPQGITGERRMA